MSEKSIEIFDEFFDRDRVIRAYEVICRWPKIPHGFFFWDVERLLRHQAGDQDQVERFRAYFGDLADFLLDYLVALMSVLPPACLLPTAMLEFWTGANCEATDKVYLHLDTHSGLRPKGQEPRPVCGTVFHLGPDDGVTGGSTFFSTEKPVPPALLLRNRTLLTQQEALALSTAWCEAPRRTNRLIRFAGDLPHFRGTILEARRPRVALFANFWATAPELGAGVSAISRVTPQEFQSYLKLNPGDFMALRGLGRRFSDQEVVSLLDVSRRLYGAP